MSWQGYGPGAGPEYPLPAGYPGPIPPPRRSSNTGLVVLIVTLASAAVLIFAVAGLWVTMSEDVPKPVGPIGPATGSATPYASPRETTEPSPSAAPPSVRRVRPKVSGWQGIGSEKYRVAYDVPKSWQPNDPGLVIGFEDRDAGILVGMSGTAEYKKGFCPSSKVESRAAVGFNGYTDDTLGPVAEHAAKKWATAAYKPTGGRSPTLSLTKPQSLRVGGMRAVRVTARATVHSTDPCDPARGVTHAVAVPGRGKSKTTVLIIWADQDVPDALTNGQARKIIESLRPLR